MLHPYHRPTRFPLFFKARSFNIVSFQLYRWHDLSFLMRIGVTNWNSNAKQRGIQPVLQVRCDEQNEVVFWGAVMASHISVVNLGYMNFFLGAHNGS